MFYNLFFYFFVSKTQFIMRKGFLFIIFFILLHIIFISCVSRKGERVTVASDSLISYCDTILGSNPGMAVRAIDSVLHEQTDMNLYYSLLMVKSKAMMFLSEYDSAKILLDSVEKYCLSGNKEIKQYKLLSGVNNMRGNLYSRRTVMDSAVVYFHKAYKYSSQLGLSPDMIDISINLADAYVRCGKFDMGAYWYRKSLLLSDTLMIDEKKRFPSYYGLAQVYMDLRDFQQCDHYFDMAGKFYDAMLPFEKHIYLNNRGNSYYYRGDYNKAMEYFKKSMQLANLYSDMEYERNFTKVNMGELYMLMDKTDSASLYLNDCYSFFKSINHTSALYYIETQLIELALKQGNVGQASRILSNAVKPEFIEPNMLHIRNKYLQHYFEESGDFKNAYYYQQKNAYIDDSIRNERIKMRSAEIALKYKQDSTLMKKEFFIKEKENQVLALRQWIYVLVLGSLFVVSLSGLLIIYKKRRSDKKIWNMQTDISTLRLENIRNRISPHFIFNVLNREMVNHGTEKDSENLISLSKLIRKNLELTGSLCITLDDELDFVKTYISIQKPVLGDDFYYEISVSDDVDTKSIQIPSMMIQIPVENALKHALRTKEGRKCLWIKVYRVNNAVCITVTDNGGGFKPNSSNRGTGTGLKVITQSIQLLNMYNKEPILMKIVNVPLENSEIGCEIRYSLPVGYTYEIKK